MLISGEDVLDSVKYDKSKAVIDDYLQWVDTEMTSDDKYLIINFCKENGIKIPNILVLKAESTYDIITDIYEYILKRIKDIYTKNKNEAKRLSDSNNK